VTRCDGVSIFDIVVRAVGIGRCLLAVVFSGDARVDTIDCGVRCITGVDEHGCSLFLIVRFS
jgi:hypothetical protein